jgi:hypothetical protein
MELFVILTVGVLLKTIIVTTTHSACALWGMFHARLDSVMSEQGAS